MALLYCIIQANRSKNSMFHHGPIPDESESEPSAEEISKRSGAHTNGVI